MILCDSCQRKSCNKILSYNVPVCNDFTPPPLDVKVGDIIWCMMKYHISSNFSTFLPWKLHIRSINDTTLFCYSGAQRVKLNKAEYKTIFFLTEEECMVYAQESQENKMQCDYCSKFELSEYGQYFMS